MRRRLRKGERRQALIARIVAIRAKTDPRWSWLAAVARVFDDVPVGLIVTVDEYPPGAPPR